MSPDNQGAALTRLREALENAGCRPRGRSALCPAHDDTQPSLTWGPRRDGRGAVMYCHGCQAPIGDLCAALSITVGDLYDEPLTAGDRRPVRLVRPGPAPKPLTAAERDKIPDPGRLVHGLIVERDWECTAFWEYVTRPFRGEPSTPEQRVKLAEAESSRIAADQWDGWFLIHRKRGAA